MNHALHRETRGSWASKLGGLIRVTTWYIFASFQQTVRKLIRSMGSGVLKSCLIDLYYFAYITAAIESYVRLKLRIKSLDCIFTTGSVVKW
jgi:hypothetical protein